VIDGVVWAGATVTYAVLALAGRLTYSAYSRDRSQLAAIPRLESQLEASKRDSLRLLAEHDHLEELELRLIATGARTWPRNS
jgi:hypothetical protein